MKRVAFGLLLLAAGCLASAQGFRITSFKGDLTLQKDGVLQVQERIEVVFDEEHHGIFRDIPVVYPTKNGVTRGLTIDSISVTDESGHKLPGVVSRQGDDIDIKIGDKNQYAPLDTPIVYVIRYECFGQMNWFDEDTSWKPYCELYWNLTGNEWQEAMDKVTFTLHFPGVAASNDVRARLFPGEYGSRGAQQLIGTHAQAADQSLGTFMELTKDTFSGGMLRPINPGEQLTLVLDLPASAIQKPTIGQRIIMMLKVNLGFVIPLIAFIFMSAMWAMYGKDPSKKPIAVQFEPPDNISGSEAGTLIDERVDQRDLAAGIVSLAVKGYLTITPAETGMVFKKRTATLTVVKREAGPELTPFEALLLGKFLGAGTVIDETALRTYVAPALGELKNSLYASMVDRGYYIADPNSVRTGWMLGGIFGVGVLGLIFWWLNPMREVFPSVAGGIVGGIIVVAFGFIMPKRTAAGAEAQRQVAGFEEFIRRAKGDEINWTSKKEPTASLFEEYLPHAIAFGLAVEWASAFEGILHEMPRWYGAPYGTPFYPMYFGNDMASISDSLGAAAATPPRSSGASGGSSGWGGGGFSGGGFGGGGGGSW